MQIEIFDDGYAICADSTDLEVQAKVLELTGPVPLIVTDPPYGNIVSERWDRIDKDDDQFSDWMVEWTRAWSKCLLPGAAFYCWGGTGIPGFRPFFKYVTKAEVKSEFELANLVTWSKKRGFGTATNYLYTREELAYFVNGSAKKPRTFNVPLLGTKRGYAGFNSKYPAKSEYYRRTNVWMDVTELLRGKVHPTEKAQRVMEIPIEVHTNPGEWVIDPFAGAGTTANACRKLGRKFLVIERDEIYFNDMIGRLR